MGELPLGRSWGGNVEEVAGLEVERIVSLVAPTTLVEFVRAVLSTPGVLLEPASRVSNAVT
jgi:hypothetical protein